MRFRVALICMMGKLASVDTPGFATPLRQPARVFDYVVIKRASIASKEGCGLSLKPLENGGRTRART